jgi:hypothetical protein
MSSMRATPVLRAYYDDSISGTDDVSPITAIGGPVMSHDRFVQFNDKWLKMLYRYRICPPLHMQDFVRPSGKHIGMYPELKLSLLEAADIINEGKLYSVSAGIPNTEFNALIPEEVRKRLIGPYALAPFCAIQMNQYVARKAQDHDLMISYLIDSGSSYPEQLLRAHGVLLEHERSKGVSHTGAIGFDTDSHVSALQAADIIAWSARRREVYGALEGDFAPLAAVLEENHDPSSGWRGSHAHVNIPREGLEMWSKPILAWLYETGKPPSFEDFPR